MLMHNIWGGELYKINFYCWSEKFNVEDLDVYNDHCSDVYEHAFKQMAVLNQKLQIKYSFFEESGHRVKCGYMYTPLPNAIKTFLINSLRVINTSTTKVKYLEKKLNERRRLECVR